MGRDSRKSIRGRWTWKSRGHEFFSNDGKTVWYDLQTPRSLVFWLAGYDIATGKRTWYHHERDEW